MLVMIIEILCFLFAVIAVGYGVYEFMVDQVTNGLLSFILSVTTFNLAVNWMKCIEE
jgi:hypothetical protein